MVRVFYVFMLSIYFSTFYYVFVLNCSSLSMQVIEQYEQPQGKREVLVGEYGKNKAESYTEWETIDLGLRCRTRRTTRWRSGL